MADDDGTIALVEVPKILPDEGVVASIKAAASAYPFTTFILILIFLAFLVATTAWLIRERMKYSSLNSDEANRLKRAMQQDDLMAKIVLKDMEGKQKILEQRARQAHESKRLKQLKQIAQEKKEAQ